MGVRRLIWAGKLPKVQCGKRMHVDIEDMEKFIENNKVKEMD